MSLRCIVCGGPAFDCKCWAAHAAEQQLRDLLARLRSDSPRGVANGKPSLRGFTRPGECVPLNGGPLSKE